MAEITLIVDPGADDITIDGVSLNDIDAFRDECLTAGDVSCDWDTLHNRLISHDISKMWWFLTESERRSIAEMAVKNTLFYTINRAGTGESGCTGQVGVWNHAVCTQNAVIRYALFSSMGSKQYTDLTKCYWKRFEASTDEFCYVPEYTYGLPCHLISRYNHSMIGVHVKHGINDLSNWIVFQYSDFDIKPGHSQMPEGLTVSVNGVTNLQCSGYNLKLVTEFDV